MQGGRCRARRRRIGCSVAAQRNAELWSKSADVPRKATLVPPQRHSGPRRLTPWRDPLPKAGPVVVFDIDGVVASMARFEHLIDSADPNWRSFNRHYGEAELISRGARLVDTVIDAGLQVVWSTTRPDAAAADSWRWLRTMDLPTGPIMTRHLVKDGAYRPQTDVKLRHWFWWNDKFGDRNPVIAWVEDDNASASTLLAHGAPIWTPKQLQRVITKANGRPFIAALAEKDHDREILRRSMTRKRPGWQKREDAYQEERSKWWDWMRMKSARARERRNANTPTPPPPHRS